VIKKLRVIHVLCTICTSLGGKATGAWSLLLTCI